MKPVNIPTDWFHWFLELYKATLGVYRRGGSVTDAQLDWMRQEIHCNCGQPECDAMQQAALLFIRDLLDASRGNYPSVEDFEASIKHGGGWFNKDEGVVVLHHHLTD
jgi:hypothetical protein